MKMKYGKNFWILSFAMFLFMTSFNLILPELNAFITELDGKAYKGLIFVLFGLSAAISRPFSGKLSDHIGRKKVMDIGIILATVIALLYPLTLSIWFFLLLRFLHGFSAGFLPTGATALVTDILPVDQRGKAMGIWGTFISLGIGVGQSVGSLIGSELGVNNLFMISAGVAVISGILIQYVRETLEAPKKFKVEQLKVAITDVFEPSVMPSAIVMFLSAVSSGIIFVITPDMSEYLGIKNKGWFFGIYVISTILIRLFTGSLSDKIGRRKTLIIGSVFLIASMLLVGLAKDVFTYTIGAVVFGLATGVMSPTQFAWTADLSHKDRRGVGAGTMFIALEIGIMFGSFSTMLTYDSTLNSVPMVFMVGVALAVVALIYLIWHLFKRHSTT